jgi:predicted DNA-binding protein YlxM (UPF0122 family)
MEYKFSNGEFVLIESSVLKGLERSKTYVEYYEKLLSYTNQTVKRKKILEELNWWKEQVETHQEKADEIFKEGTNEEVIQ